MKIIVEPYRKFADFEGRARRKEYWLFVLFVIGSVVLLWSLAILGELAKLLPLQYGAATLAIALVVVSLVPWIALRIRRLHDINATGWLIFIGIIPYLGALVLLVLSVLPGTAGVNRYGKDPKGDPAAAKAAEIFS